MDIFIHEQRSKKINENTSTNTHIGLIITAKHFQ